jgi:pyridine nucleotide-disulfide oxidoreductase family protein
MKRLVLVGGGHAHLSVLEKFARNRVANTELILVTPNRYQNYSGMLPGWIAGHYTREQSRVDLLPLVGAARAKMITLSLKEMSAHENEITLSDGRVLNYDYLSLDVGSETNTEGFELLGERLLPVKPLDDFFDQWPDIHRGALLQKDYSLFVVGGGAAGVELALAAQYALRRDGATSAVSLVVSKDGMLRGHHESVRERVLNYVRASGVVLYQQAATGLVDGLRLEDGQHVYADKVLAATGARPLGWLKSSGLTLNEQGYILVDSTHRTASHSNVFAAGDTCARTDVRMARSGVHAVRAGPVLAENLYALLNDPANEKQLKKYRPKAYSLYLLACGPRYAIASWGYLSFEGAWVWRLKDWIDKGFVRKFSADKSYSADSNSLR